jgi:hypothetical protein
MVSAIPETHPVCGVGQHGGGDYNGPDPMVAVSAGECPETETASVARSFNVHQFLGDTEILEAEGDSGEYPSFIEARDAAVEYLEGLISLCEDSLEEIRDAEYFEEYRGTAVSATSASDPGEEAERNVRIISAGHYQLTPEIREKPMPWFVGRFVKLNFPIPGGLGEYMWVLVTSHKGDELVGTLDNEPVFADLDRGDEIVFRPEEIVAVDGYSNRE